MIPPIPSPPIVRNKMSSEKTETWILCSREDAEEFRSSNNCWYSVGKHASYFETTEYRKRFTNPELAAALAEVERLRDFLQRQERQTLYWQAQHLKACNITDEMKVELTALSQRVDGGLCKMLSLGDKCECSICILERKNERLKSKLHCYKAAAEEEARHADEARAELATLQAESLQILKKTRQLAVGIHRLHFKDCDTWEVGDDTSMILSQISNMAEGLVRANEPPKPAVPTTPLTTQIIASPTHACEVWWVGALENTQLKGASDGS